MTQYRARVRTFIDEALRATGWSPNRLAKECGFSPTVLTRFLNDADYTGTPSARHQAAIAAKTGIPVPSDAPAGFGETDALRLDGAQHQDLVAALYPGAPNAHAWQVRGRAMDAAGILPGDTIIVDLDLRPVDGDIVLVELYDWEAGNARTVLRRYRAPWLLTESLATPAGIPINADDRGARIAGTVVYVGRPLRGEANAAA